MMLTYILDYKGICKTVCIVKMSENNFGLNILLSNVVINWILNWAS